MKVSTNVFGKKNFFVITFISIFLIANFFIPNKASASFSDIIGGPTTVVNKIIAAIKEKKTDWLKNIATKVYQKTLTQVLNKLAYDAATYIGTGGEGQSELFTTDYVKDFALDASNAAFGGFVDSISKDWQVDLCQPTGGIDAKIALGLGLVQYNQPTITKPNCDFQTLVSNWTSEFEKWKSLTDKDYLGKLADSFSPTNNDVMVSLTMFDRAKATSTAEKEKQETQLSLNKGWLDVRNAGGKAESTPGEAEKNLDSAKQAEKDNLANTTGNILMDAANIFLNQVAITGFDTIIKKLGDIVLKGDTAKTNYSSANVDYGSYSGKTYMVDALKKIIQPKFNVSADYDALSTLMICLDENNPAPNNCVIDSNFSQAVQNKNTVIEAINNGYLNANWTFSDENSYLSGFNYRSLIILKKFRIIPLGWEEAFTRAEEKTRTTGYKYTLMDMVSCYDPSDSYETFSSGFLQSNFSSYDWCQGLIDPDWVLKSPLNYCKKQGYGGYIVTQQLINISDEVASSTNVDPIIISRSDDYCADEQSCIKENADGSCEYYGYCTEEKRSWNFGENSCKAVYNTCDSFTSASTGEKLALLKNTIDTSSCDSSNVGCAEYSISGIYSTSSAQVVWSNLYLIRLNSKAETCSESNEGCQEFIRTNSGSGHNFLMNGSFENNINTDWQNLSTSSDEAQSGNISAKLPTTGSLSANDIIVASSNHSIAGETYTLSFYSHCDGANSSYVTIGSDYRKNISTSTDFIYNALTYTYPSNYSNNKISFNIFSQANTCYIDDIKLERGSTGTFYSEYRGEGLIYEKIIPDYLKTACYENPYVANPDYKLKEDAPEQCYKYARLCNNEEIGCNIFTSVYGIKIAAKALDKDYCSEQCVGYDVYVQKNTLFENNFVNKFIPSSAQACLASEAGCTEFTNLDELAAGGEGKEYYTYLRTCIKPGQGTCNDFYSWEGSDGAGYQLKSYRFEKDSNQPIPKVTLGNLSANGNTYSQEDDNNVILCDQTIHNLSASDPDYNSDCREFYNRSGQLIYALYSTTITCSDNCKTYRMTEKNIDSDISSESSCQALGSSAHWDSNNNVCYHCLNGGIWDDDQSACLYKAIPGEGQTCRASSNNCREYNGNSGNSVRIISAFDFNDSDNLSIWSGNVTSSNESLNQGGKSMKLTGQAKVEVGTDVSKNSSYILKLLIKNTQTKDLSISFSNGTDTSLFGVAGDDQSNYSINIPASSGWQLYQVNLSNLDHNISNTETLNLSINSGEMYISSIVLMEVSSRYYLIKDSWTTPNICYYDAFGNYQGINYNLGCQAYTDNYNSNYNLRQFSSLCSDSAVGCEMMIKTNNSDSYNSEIFNDTNNNGVCGSDEEDCIKVEADQFTPVVYNSSKLCSFADKGCSRLGKIISSNSYSTSQNIYQDTYVKINPNNFSTILCKKSEVGCDAWSSSLSSGDNYYFKNPGNNLCQWRKGSDTNSGFAWYKKAVYKCKEGNTFTSNLCIKDHDTSDGGNSDCSTGQKCELDNGDYLCPVELFKTISSDGTAIYQPSEQAGVKWAGLCPMTQAGCTEYIDPISSFSSNIIINPNFADLNGDGHDFDYWVNNNTSSGECSVNSHGGFTCSVAGNTMSYHQTITIEPNKLYILETKGQQTATLENCNNSSIYKLNNNNSFISTASLKVTPNESKKIFYSGTNTSCKVTYEKQITNSAVSRHNINNVSNNSLLNNILNIKTAIAEEDDFRIEIREAVVDHQLQQELNFSDCDGQANLSNGCVLFNERVGTSSLTYNASNYSNYTS
ncbi:MAG TPA: hypothetical protein PLE28_02150, partial [bacterium]|nr:hypothetical protein [bacterium]